MIAPVPSAASGEGMLHVCPTDTILASAQRVWDLVSTPRLIAQWSDTTIVQAPDREVIAGDRLILGVGVGRRLRVMFIVEDALRPQRLSLRIRLPIGVTNHEVIAISSIGPEASRVTFN